MRRDDGIAVGVYGDDTAVAVSIPVFAFPCYTVSRLDFLFAPRNNVR
jgi:hypothetical protein